MKKMKKMKISFVLLVISAILISFTSCICGSCGDCDSSFYQVTYKNGDVEYYPEDDLYMKESGMVKMYLRDSTGARVSERFIPQSDIERIDLIQGDIPTDTLSPPIVPVEMEIEMESGSDNIRIKSKSKKSSMIYMRSDIDSMFNGKMMAKSLKSHGIL